MSPSRFALAAALAAAISIAFGLQPGKAETSTGREMSQISPDLVMPVMDAKRGKHLFASKGCVVCHSINGVGGTYAQAGGINDEAGDGAL